jgi:signal transduction histidine kinase
MSVLWTAAALVLDALAVTVLAWATLVAFRARRKPSAQFFGILVGTLTLWALCSQGSELPGMPTDGLLAVVWDLGQLFAGVFIPGFWLLYALSYTGRGAGFTWRRGLMLVGIALPLIVSAAVLALRPGRQVVEAVIAAMFATELLYTFVLFVYATYLLVGLSRRQDRVSWQQAMILILAVALPYLTGVLGNIVSPADSVTLAFLASGGSLVFAVRRYPVLTGFPKADYIARTRVVEGLQEAVVVLDWEGYILDANAATEELFDVSSSELVGEPLDRIDERIAAADLSPGVTGNVTLRTTKGQRRFQYTVSAVDSTMGSGKGRSDAVARTLLLRDVTDRRTREQRLTVLNRVLRHNVRNKLDVVLAHASVVEDDAVRTTIRENAAELLALSEKARDAEEMMTASEGPPSTVDLTDVAAAVAEDYREEYPDADLSLRCPTELTVTTHRRVVEAALSELVENSIVHSETTPTVEIAVAAGASAAAELAVTDQGPGIPEREQRILAEGTESQLEHGTGIGLWFVNWAVVQLGGDLSFAENDPTGSVVTIRLFETTADALPQE